MEEEIEKAVRFDRETCRWVVLGEAAEVHRSTERDRVLKVLAGAPEGLSSGEIMALAQFPTRNAADLALSRMATDGIIERVKRGLYGLPGTRTKLASKTDRQIDRSEQKGTKTQ
jgi:hypothetical protein